ncbi:MAG: hypothetical protein ACD_2C00039G0006 [uncultured bacterium (gcode 4)]|uniref:Uncharacterized protein n=1 Tax=uncultured bacterium (gcode 4) TaxID=1234023 RepID=K2G716_9BACT|nr:MAG: hypothetical protein ACD_2C00039G0006 [uncultured bacterium (gcode 4)]
MNYLILKSIIEATVMNFRCKECSSTIADGNINMLGMAWNSINMEVNCPNCKTQWIVKAEIGFMNQNWTPEVLNNLKNTMQNIREWWEQLNVESIKDSDIMNIRENLKKCSSVEDLFKL